jgi:hypothetical protein
MQCIGTRVKAYSYKKGKDCHYSPNSAVVFVWRHSSVFPNILY